MPWQDDLAGPLQVTGAEVEALDLGGRALPSSLRTHYRRAAKCGWRVAVVTWRRPALAADGTVKPLTEDVAQFDPETGVPLLTPTGRPQVKKVPIPGTALLQDTVLLQALVAWEGFTQGLAVIWTDGKFEQAWYRWPHLGRLSSPELKTFIESGGTPPDRQRGVPITLWQEKAAKAAGKEDDDGEQ